MAKQKQTEKKSIISPLIRSNGEKHLLEEMMDGPQDEMPILTSVGYHKVGPSKTGWISYVIKTQGDKVIEVSDVSEPDLKDIAEESAKIAFVTNFIDREAF